MRMKSLLKIGILTLALGVAFTACSPYRQHKRVAHKAAKNVGKPPMSILDFTRKGCGCN
jgi:hypothetical protein